MTRTLALITSIFVLGLILTWELMPPGGSAEPLLARPEVSGPAGSFIRGPSADELAGIAATILARPLFSPDRRPPSRPRDAAVATAAAGDKAMPRLAGTIVGPSGARALFADTNGKARGAVEGDTIAGFTVQTILPGAVTVMGPDGPRVLRPSHITAQSTAGSPRPQGDPQ